MSGDNYFRHKVVMEVGTRKPAHQEPVANFKDDRELLAYLLEQERLGMAAQSPKKTSTGRR